MMRPEKYLKRLSPLLLSISLFGCASVEEKVVSKTKYIEQRVQLQERPKPVNLYPVKFFAVTEENLETFLSTFEKENGDIVFFAISVTDYENMSLNVAELKRYIEQQKSLIVYYETNVNANELVEPEVNEEMPEKGIFNKIKGLIGIE